MSSQKPTRTKHIVEEPFPGEISSNPTIIRLVRQRNADRISGFIGLGLITAIAVATLLLLMLGMVFVYGTYEYSGRIFPGIKVNNLDLGGMTVSEAALLLENSSPQTPLITITTGVQSAQLPLIDLGITMDAYLTSQKALEIGHHGTFISRMKQLIEGLKNGWRVEPIWSLDMDKARQGVEGMLPAFSKLPKNAHFQVEEGKLQALPGEIGYSINIEETLIYLHEHLDQVIQNRMIPIPLQPTLPEITEINPYMLNEANKLIDRPTVIQVYDPVLDKTQAFTIPKSEIADWLVVRLVDGEASISFSEAKISIYLTDLSSKLGQGRHIYAEDIAPAFAQNIMKNPQFKITLSYQPTNYQVQPGDTLLKLGWKLGLPYWMILNANPGLNAERLIAGSILTIPAKTDLLPLPPVPGKRIVINLTRQRLSAYENGKQIGQFIISTGIDRSPTQPGIFQIQTHEKNAYASVWDLYMPNFLGIYEAWPGFMNGIHGLPLLSNGRRMWAENLGRPSSYGCIILGLEEARWLYNWAENGVIVEIRE